MQVSVKKIEGSKMQIASDFHRFDKHCVQTRSLQRAQLFGDTLFIGKILLAPEIDLQFRLDETGQQKDRKKRSRDDAHRSSISQESLRDNRKQQAESRDDRLDVTNMPEVEENFDRHKRETNDRDFPGWHPKFCFFPQKDHEWR